MTVRPLRWADFKGDWQDFQRLCADLVEDHGYIAELRSPGGGDQGRDIDAFEIIAQFPVQKRRIAFWVECKSRLSFQPRTVLLEEISKCILYARIEGVPALVFMTNHKLSNEAKDQISKLTQLNDFGLGVSYIEQEILDNLIIERPDIYRKYFFGPPPPPPKPRSSSTYGHVQCILRSDRYEVAKNSSLRLTATNTSFKHVTIEVYDGRRLLTTVNVDPLSRTETVLSRPMQSPPEENVLSLIAQEPDVEVSLDSRLRPSILSPTLNQFVDPLHLAHKIAARIDQERDTYITGAGGVGKTTLALESVRISDHYAIHLDADKICESTRLTDLLVEQVPLGLSTATKAQRPAGVHNDRYDQHSKLTRDDGLERDGILGAIIESLKNAAMPLAIVIDNVHNCDEADTPTLQRLLVERPTKCFVFTARPAEYRSTAIEQLVNRERQDDQSFVVRLNQEVIRRTLPEILNNLSQDDETRRFLAKFRETKNFQTLKALLEIMKLKGMLEDGSDDGKYKVSNDVSLAQLGDYAEIVEALLTCVVPRNQRKLASEILEIAAIWGGPFPSDLVIFAKGAAGEKCLYALMRSGLIIDNTEGVIDLRFDHKLTEEILLKGIPSTRKRQIHREIGQFLDALGPRSVLASETKRAYHFAGAGDYGSAAQLLFSYLDENRHRISRLDALAVACDALKHFDQHPKGTLHSENVLKTEVTLLTWIIELGYLAHGPDWGIDFLRRLEFRAYAESNAMLLGRAAYYWSRHLMYQEDDTEALARANTAVRLLAGYPHDPYLIRALNRLGNIQKNRSQFVTSANTHREAVTVARRSNQVLELSRSIRELGATFLEAGRPQRALQLWDQALHVAEATGDVEEIVTDRVNLAYIVALTRSGGADLGAMFEDIDRVSRQFGLLAQQAKNYINWGNWLFHEEKQAVAGCSKISEALKLATTLDFEYVKVLALLSYESFAATGAAVPRQDYEKILYKFIDHKLLVNGRLELMADHRMTILVKFLITYFRSSLNPAVLQTTNVTIRNFLDDLDRHSLVEVEKGNPYFRPETKVWAIYY